jgi:hypothetical protein
MTGGLIELVSKGIRDDFLIRNPEITFFKVVYKKYTRFAFQFTELDFDNDYDFDFQSTVKLQPYGDLAHKIFLKIELPQVSMSAEDYISNQTLKTEYLNHVQIRANERKKTSDLALSRYNNLKNYADLVFGSHRIMNNLLKPDKINIIKIKQDILSFKNRNNDVYNKYIKLVAQNILLNTNIISFVISFTDVSTTARDSLIEININYSNNLQKFLSYYYFDYLEKLGEHEQSKNTKIDFAWNHNLGHYIARRYDWDIDGTSIDYYTNDFFHVYQNLVTDNSIKRSYDKLIGNVPELTTFNNSTKPNYTLYIPLIFDFCTNNGNSIPLTSLGESDIQLSFLFEEIKKLCYLEDWGIEFDKIALKSILRSDVIINSWDIDKININNNENIYFSTVKFEQKTNKIRYSAKYLYDDDINTWWPDLTTINLTYILDTYGSLKDGDVKRSLDKDEWIKFRVVYTEDDNINTGIKDYHYYVDKSLILNSIKMLRATILVQYVFLDIVEQRKFGISTLEYLITTTFENLFYVDKRDDINCSLSFNKLMKELIWFVQPVDFREPNKFQQTNQYTYIDSIKTNQLVLDNVRFFQIPYQKQYFTELTHFQTHTFTFNSFVHLFSFALEPEKYQPSGTCNFSSFKDKTLQLVFEKDSVATHGKLLVKVFSRSYNILQVTHGKGRLIFE